MKYDTLRKQNRNSQVWQYKKSNPNLSYAEIALKFSISRQRCHQIIRRMEELNGNL